MVDVLNDDESKREEFLEQFRQGIWTADENLDDEELRRMNELSSTDLSSEESWELVEAYERVPRSADPVKEAILYDPRTMVQPIVTNGSSRLAGDAVEDSIWTTDRGQTVVGLGSVQLREIQRVCSLLFTRHPLARNIVRNYEFLTIGEGVTISWLSKSKRRDTGEPSAPTQREREWREIERRTGFQQYVRRLVRMTFLLGEWFTATYPERRTKGALKDGFVGIEPDRVPMIAYNSEDQSDVRGYVLVGLDGSKKIVKPEDMVHARICELGNVPRGIPILLPVLSFLRYWSLFIENRHWLNMTRSRLPLIRRVKGSGAQVSAEKARLTSIGLPKPAHMVVDPEGYEWQFPQMNLGASDAREDGRLISLAIASGVNLPEFLVTADASNANYSSALVAESPTHRMFKDYQEQFRTIIEELVMELTGRAQDEFVVNFPPIIRRAIGEQSAAVSSLVDRGIWSRRTACEVLGRPWEGEDGEAARIAAERDEGFDLTFPGIPNILGAPMAPNAKKKDGGPGEPPAGGSLGAAASPRERPKTTPEAKKRRGRRAPRA